MILNAFILALRQIRRNFLRAFLTMLGIIIGVGAVIVMISLGNGTTKMIGDRISSLGSNLLLVFPARVMNPSGTNLRRNFSLQEAQNLYSLTQEYIQALAPIAQSSVTLQYQAQNTSTQVQGINAAFFEVTQWESSEGRIFEDNEYRVGSNVCLIGESVRKNLFIQENPLGKRIRINSIVCECIGVLESKGQGGMGNDQDDMILLPLKTFLRSISGNNTLFYINRLMLRT
ncbi:ABC transporter permease, partial [Helicobacter typhlonius]